MDPLLKKVFARVGFLQARMWKNHQEETQSFFAENPELAFLIMKEMVERREQDISEDLPASEFSPTMPPMRDNTDHKIQWNARLLYSHLDPRKFLFTKVGHVDTQDQCLTNRLKVRELAGDLVEILTIKPVHLTLQVSCSTQISSKRHSN
jgi:hypothetical protein